MHLRRSSTATFHRAVTGREKELLRSVDIRKVMSRGRQSPGRERLRVRQPWFRTTRALF